jgi:hypothetical protein
MGTTDAQAAVSHGYNNMQVRPSHLEPGCIGQGTAMKPMEGMGVKKSIKKSGAANIRHNGNLVAGKPDGLEGLI